MHYSSLRQFLYILLFIAPTSFCLAYILLFKTSNLFQYSITNSMLYPNLITLPDLNSSTFNIFFLIIFLSPSNLIIPSNFDTFIFKIFFSIIFPSRIDLIIPLDSDSSIFKVFFPIIFPLHSEEILEDLRKLDFLGKFW